MADGGLKRPLDLTNDEDPAPKRDKSQGIFADDPGNDDDFGSFVADTESVRERPAGSASVANSFSFHGGTARSLAPTPQLRPNASGLDEQQPQQYQDDGPPEVEGPTVMCTCGLPCAKLEARTDRNAGRMFFRCPKPKGDGQCAFFQWEDEPQRASPGGANFGNGVAPYGGGSSAGGPSPGSNPSSKPGTTCFKCGKEGHWSRDCPNPGQQPPAYVGGGQQGGYGGGAGLPVGNEYGGGGPAKNSGACFKCGQEGHWSRDCPNAGGGGGAGHDGGGSYQGGAYGGGSSGGGGSGGSKGTCFRCGQEGHWSNACPNASGGRRY